VSALAFSALFPSILQLGDFDVERDDFSEGARKEALLEAPKGPFPFLIPEGGAIPNNWGFGDVVIFFFTGNGMLGVDILSNEEETGGFGEDFVAS